MAGVGEESQRKLPIRKQTYPHTVFKGISDEIPLVGNFDVACIVQLELLERATLEARSAVRVWRAGMRRAQASAWRQCGMSADR